MAYPQTPFDPKNPFSDPRVNPYAATQPATTPFTRPVKATNGLAVSGVILSVIGAFLFFFPVIGPLLAFIGVVLAAFGWRSANKKLAGSGKRLSIAAVLIGLVGFLSGGAVTGALATVSIYTANAGLEFSEIRREVTAFESAKGRLPLSLDELNQPELTRDWFGNRYGYAPSEEGTYQVSAAATGWFWNLFEDVAFTYHSTDDSVRDAHGHRVMDSKQLEEMDRAMNGGRSAAGKSAAKPAGHPSCEGTGTSDAECPHCPAENKEAPAVPAEPDA